MDSSSPLPVQLLSARPLACPAPSSPRLGDSGRNCESPRTGLVASQNGRRRSYGTVVGDRSTSFKSSNAFVVEHRLDEEDTLQGLALKYGVTVQDIVKVNGVWNTEALLCKPHIKIPVSASSSENSLSTSPLTSPDLISTTPMERAPGMNSAPDSLLDSRLVEELDSSGEEVRSKLDGRRQKRNQHVLAQNTTAQCDKTGVKNITDILNCADVQLKNSRLFVEKLAKRNDSLSVPKDAYHRTHEDRQKPRSASLLPELLRESSPKSGRRFHLKRVETTPEKIEAHRNELEEKLFEL